MNDKRRNALPKRPWWVFTTSPAVSLWGATGFGICLLLFVPGFVEDVQAGKAPAVYLLISAFIAVLWIIVLVASLLWTRRNTPR